MSQATAAIANMSRTLFRAAVNAALQALQSGNSGATAPTETYPYMLWADTTTGWLKQRNAANSAWIERVPLATARADIASAATLNLDAATSAWLRVTGTTTTTAVTLADGSRRTCVAAAAWPLTHGVSLILPGAASYTCAAGDILHFIGESGGVVRVEITKADGTAVVAAVASGVVGLTRNCRMSITTASASGTVTADEIIVETALGGTAKQLASYSQAINLATTGAGGMDTGSAPVSGFVSIYAIAKADGTKSVLACAVATSTAEIYGGANMPSGYTFSALLGILPTNGSSQFLPGLLENRKFHQQAAVNVVASTAGPTTLTSASLSSAVPAAARFVDLVVTSYNAGAGFNPAVAADSTGTAARAAAGVSTGTDKNLPAGMTTATAAASFHDVPIITSQTIWWMESNANAADKVYVTAYRV